ncbi:MAG: hypothetical protein HYX93_05700 [Chloroflexi bacterium]|nr:hypothetical protein [Chloroflexota bacterium]
MLITSRGEVPLILSTVEGHERDLKYVMFTRIYQRMASREPSGVYQEAPPFCKHVLTLTKCEEGKPALGIAARAIERGQLGQP